MKDDIGRDIVSILREIEYELRGIKNILGAICDKDMDENGDLD
jgi:hypothetical protein